MKYRCLVLDHDDTVVNSTPVIHYPAFKKILEDLRPGVFYTQEEFLALNLDPGLWPFYKQVLHFTDEELSLESEIWHGFVERVIPPFFPEMKDLIDRFRKAGGIVCVVSHSFEDMIRRDYRAAGVAEPEWIFGWNNDRSKCKPNPYPLEEILRRTGLDREDLLMVDDLRPGYEMARNCGVDFAACGWGYEVPEIEAFMRANADYYLASVAELETLLFDGEKA